MLRIASAFLALVALFGCAPSEAVQPPVNPRAIAVLVSTDPWLMVIGSDTPRVALYDDGYVIYAEQTSEDQYVHMAARLTPSELARVKAKLLAFTTDPVPTQINLRPGWTDQPETNIALDVDGHKLITYINGRLGPVEELDGTLRKPANADPLPAQVEGLIQYLSEFRVANAKPWVPEQLEVMLWDYGYAPEASIQWPSDWPGLHDPTTLKRGDDSYSVFLPGKQEEKLIEFLATRKDKGAIEVDGKKMVASYRRVFPRWKDAFRG